MSRDDDDVFGVDPDWERKGREEYARAKKVECKYCKEPTTNTGYGYCHSCYDLRRALENASATGRTVYIPQMLRDELEGVK